MYKLFMNIELDYNKAKDADEVWKRLSGGKAL